MYNSVNILKATELYILKEWILWYVKYIPIQLLLKWKKRWTDKQIIVYSYYENITTIKMDKWLKYINTWMNLKKVLSLRIQTQKSVHFTIPFTWVSKNTNLIYSDREQSSGWAGLGLGGLTGTEHQGTFWADGNVLYHYCGDGHTGV